MPDNEIEIVEKNELTNIERTRALANRAHKLGIMPDSRYRITHADYKYSFSMKKNDKAYLDNRMLRDDVEGSFENCMLMLNGNPISDVRIVDYYTNELITSFDEPLLTSLFSVLFENLKRDLPHLMPVLDEEAEEELKRQFVSDIEFYQNRNDSLLKYQVFLYVPDLMRYVGAATNPSQEQIDAFVDRIKEFCRMTGVLRVVKRNNVYHDRYPIMPVAVYEQSTNTILVGSPFMNKLIEIISRDTSYPLVMNGKIVEGKYKPIVTTHENSIMGGMKNRRAYQVIDQMVILFSTSGSKTMHKYVRDYLNNCSEIVYAANMTPEIKKKNQIIKRTFEAAYRELPVRTDLLHKYANVRFSAIPKYSELGKVMNFKHDGLLDVPLTDEEVEKQYNIKIGKKKNPNWFKDFLLPLTKSEALYPSQIC